MRFKFVLSFLCTVLLAGVAVADSNPAPDEKYTGCFKYKMCDAQTGQTDCTVLPASGDERVINASAFSNITFYSTESTATTYACDIMSNDTGHDAATPVGDGHKINTASLTQTARILSLSGFFQYVWVTCPTITAGNVTVNALVCGGR